MRLTILFANLGRGTIQQATRSWQNLAAHADDVDVVLPIEVDEGDVGYHDHTLMRQAFPKVAWKTFAFKTRQPILVRAALEVKHSAVRRAGVAVKHQSPPRQDCLVVIPDLPGDPLTEVHSSHAAAGFRNGHRNPVARAALGVSWHAWRLRMRWGAHRAHQRGRHYVACFDANDRKFGPLHPLEVRLFQYGPDYGVAVPAKGWRVKHSPIETVETYIEKLHQGRKVTVRFVKE